MIASRTKAVLAGVRSTPGALMGTGNGVLLATLFFAASWVAAASLVARLRVARDGVETLAFGMAGALVLVCWLPFLGGLLFGINAGAFSALGVATALAVCGVWSQRESLKKLDTLRLPARGELIRRAVLLALLAVGLAYFAKMQWTHGMEPRDGGIHAAGAAWEDQPGHTAIALSFLHGDNLQRFEYPWFAGWPLGYPFLPDYLSAALQPLGAGLSGAVWLGMLFSSAAFLLTAYCLAREWFSSRAVAALGVLLALLGGGFGFVHLCTDFPVGKTLLEAIFTKDYGNDFDGGIHLHNLTTALLLVMRGSTFGMPIAFTVFLLLGRAAEQKSARHALAASVLTAALPMIHMHAFLVIGLTAAVWVVVWKVWPPRIIAAWLAPLFLALPQLLRTQRQLAQSNESFIRVQAGWMSAEGGFAVQAKYWLMNGGIFLPLSVLAFMFVPARARKFTAPFLVLFAVCTFVVFQPNDYDNIKLFAFSVCIFAMLCAAVLVRLWQRPWWGKCAAIVLGITISASGLLSILHEWKSSWRIAGPLEIEFAEKVRTFTPPDALLLTGKRPTHPAFFLSGRRVFLGFHNWIGQHGMPIEPRRTEVHEMFTAGPRAEELLKQHGLRYVVIGPPEREEFGSELNEHFFKERAEDSASVGEYTIYRLR